MVRFVGKLLIVLVYFKVKIIDISFEIISVLFFLNYLVLHSVITKHPINKTWFLFFMRDHFLRN